MEPTFYEDARYSRGAEEEMRSGSKRPMTLDLGASRSKKPRPPTALLTSPDLHMLKLESPELEKLIMQQHAQDQHCMYPNRADDHYHPATRDHFPDALLQPHPSYLYPQNPPTDTTGAPPMAPAVDSYGYPQQQHHHQHHQHHLAAPCSGSNPMVSSSSYSGGGYYGVGVAAAVVKEEPQTVPCASPPDPPTSPIDMQDQEKMKLERKRLRNRIAASKCRRRKLERIARLEDKVAHLKGENAELQGHVTRLKEHVCHLKQQVLDHVRSGCDILVTTDHPSYGDQQL